MICDGMKGGKLRAVLPSHVFVRIRAFFCIALLLSAGAFVYAQTFDELYDDSSDFYSSADYAKINGRASESGKTWLVMLYDLGLDSTGGHSDYAMFKSVSKSVTSPNVKFVVQARNVRGDVVRYRLYKGAVTSAGFKKSEGGISESLSSFIQWSKKSYGGDRILLIIRGLPAPFTSGVCFDAFSGAYLDLNGLKSAVVDSGVDLDLIVFDTGLSSSLETAYMLSPAARYMVGSQENLPPDAFDYETLAKSLSKKPSSSAFETGMLLADSYIERLSEDDFSRSCISMIDLSQVGSVFSAFTKAADSMDSAATSIDDFKNLSSAFSSSLGFGHHSSSGASGMIDLADFALLASDVIDDSSTELLDAVYSAVAYEIHGEGLSQASGLSFYYPKNLSAKELDSYSEICTCGPYLAYLDACFDSWKAPSWVYSSKGKKSGRVPCLRPFAPEKSALYPVSMSEKNNGSGNFSVNVTSGSHAVSSVDFSALYMEENSGAVIRMETASCPDDGDSESAYGACFDGKGLTFDGHPIWIEKAGSADGYEFYYSPVKLNGENSVLLIQHDFSGDSFKISGIYAEYFSKVTGRAKKELNEGDVLEFLFPSQFGVDVREVMAVYGSAVYDSSSVVEKAALPDGFYMCFFTVRDIFGNKYESMGKSFTLEGGQIVGNP